MAKDSTSTEKIGEIVDFRLEGDHEPAHKAELLEEWIKESISYIEDKRKKNKHLDHALRISALFFAAAITVLLGLEGKFADPDLTRTISLILAAAVTFLNALISLFQNRATWILHENAQARFEKLNDDFRYFRAGKQRNDYFRDDVQKFYQEYIDTWSSLNERLSEEVIDRIRTTETK